MDENQEKKGVKRYHYTPIIDIMILNQYLENPPTNAHFGQTIERWKEIDNVLRLGNGWTGIRSRVLKLIKEFKNKNMESLKKSGVEEEYEEREILLQEIVDLSKEKRITENEQGREYGMLKREAAFANNKERVEQLSEILKTQTIEENELEKEKLSVQRLIEENRKMELEIKKEKQENEYLSRIREIEEMRKEREELTNLVKLLAQKQ